MMAKADGSRSAAPKPCAARETISACGDDRTFRREARFQERRNTVDFDFHHRFQIIGRQELTLGIGLSLYQGRYGDRSHTGNFAAEPRRQCFQRIYPGRNRARRRPSTIHDGFEVRAQRLYRLRIPAKRAAFVDSRRAPFCCGQRFPGRSERRPASTGTSPPRLRRTLHYLCSRAFSATKISLRKKFWPTSSAIGYSQRIAFLSILPLFTTAMTIFLASRPAARFSSRCLRRRAYSPFAVR